MIDLKSHAGKIVDTAVKLREKQEERKGNGYQEAFPHDLADQAHQARRAPFLNWIQERGIDARLMLQGDAVRFKFNHDRWEYENQIDHYFVGQVCIHNSTGEANTFDNKITVTPNRIVSHQVTTDADFLEPTATQLHRFAQALQRAVDQEIEKYNENRI